jgi:hypothetical protein
MEPFSKQVRSRAGWSPDRMAKRPAVVTIGTIGLERGLQSAALASALRGAREAMLSGRLRPGARLPSTRVLARDLETSRHVRRTPGLYAERQAALVRAARRTLGGCWRWRPARLAFTWAGCPTAWTTAWPLEPVSSTRWGDTPRRIASGPLSEKSERADPRPCTLGAAGDRRRVHAPGGGSTRNA